jgi:site-specific recombinase XerD
MSALAVIERDAMMGSDALLTPEALAFAARVREAQRGEVKDKSYRATPIGGEVGRFLRSLRWSDASENTILSYETTLSRLSSDFAHRELHDVTLDDLREFLDDHWGESAPATRRQRLAAVKSFFAWAQSERGIPEHPIARVRPPKVTDVSRNAYAPDVIEKLREAQPTLRDQICVQLCGRLGLRRNELRLIQVGDFNLAHGTVKVHAKGGHIHRVPLGFPSLKTDIEVHVVGRGGDEYLLYPKTDVTRPMSLAGVHYWFKRALRRAGLPESIELHELRHSAADNLWRETGDLVLAQKLLRHKSPGTTAAYLHPTMEDLSSALEALDG